MAKPKADPAPSDDDQKSAPDPAPALLEAEAKTDPDPDMTVTLTFRGAEFTADRRVVGSARVALALARRDFGGLLAELVEPSEYDRWLEQIKRGESIFDVTVEYFRAVRIAIGMDGGEEEGNDSSVSPSS